MIFYYVLIAVSPFLNVPLISHVVSDPFKVLGSVCILFAAFEIICHRWHAPFFRTPQSWLFVAFFLLAMISDFAHGARIERVSPFLIYVSMVVFFFVTVTLVNSVPRLRNALISAALAIPLGAAYLLREWLGSRGRVGMAVGDGNYFSTAAVLYLPFALLIVLEKGKSATRLFFAGCVIIGLVGVTLCASRGGFIALLAAVLVLMLRTRAIRLLLAAAVVLVPLVLLLPSSPLRRLTTPTQTDRDNAQRRRVAWHAGLRMIAEQPLTGVGLGNYKRRMPRYADGRSQIDPEFASMAHNAYLEIAAELGLPVLLVYLGIIAFSLRSLDKVVKSTAKWPGSDLHRAALALQAGLIGYMAGSFFLSTEYQKPFWFAIFLSMCLPELCRRVRRSERAPTAPGQDAEGPMVDRLPVCSVESKHAHV